MYSKIVMDDIKKNRIKTGENNKLEQKTQQSFNALLDG